MELFILKNNHTVCDEAILNSDGILYVTTGEHTSRYAHGKYIVEQNSVPIEYNQYHKKLSLKDFQHYWEKSNLFLENRSTHTYQVGNDPRFNIHVCVETELKWHQTIAKHLFLDVLDTPLEKWSLRCCPNLHLSNHPALIAICLQEKSILICGTGYGGEIKKSLFTVMNMILPKHQVLPLHCSAVLSNNTSSLLLGLSGTGKTTLSTSDDFTLIGDDEIAWTKKGIFNIEGGCYAKTIHLSKEKEPRIYNAIKPPCLLENVILNEGVPDFSNNSITDNIRAAYPLSNLKNTHEGLAPHPKNIILLCCDLYGVIPGVSLLTPEQALHHFLTGYTAKIGSTESGSNAAIVPISSPCFGHPFFPLPLAIYAKLFKEKLLHHNPCVWLVNTGWHSGDYTNGRRYDITTTRMIIKAICDNKITSNTQKHPFLDLSYIAKIHQHNLDFSQDWLHHPSFKKGCQILSSLFLSREKTTIQD